MMIIITDRGWCYPIILKPQQQQIKAQQSMDDGDLELVVISDELLKSSLAKNLRNLPAYFVPQV